MAHVFPISQGMDFKWFKKSHGAGLGGMRGAPGTPKWNPKWAGMAVGERVAN